MTYNFRINNFDLIRIFAALQVVYHHCVSHFDIREESILLSWTSLFPGVPIFFVVSGFLISASFERNNNLKLYFYNRFIRIYPALWACFILSVFSVVIFYNLDSDVGNILSWSIAQLTIGQFYNPDFLRGYGVGVLNGSLWTIPVELQFYLLLPFIYLVLNYFKWNKVIIFSLGLAFILINQLYFYMSYFQGEQTIVYKLFGVTIFPYLYMFAIGIIIQRNMNSLKKYLVNKAHFLLVIYLISLYVSNLLSLSYEGNFINPMSAILLGMLVISVAYSYTDKLSGITKGYDISYGVYIYHMVFVNVFVEHSNFSAYYNLFFTFSLTLLTATLSWIYIEKPCLKTKLITLKSK